MRIKGALLGAFLLAAVVTCSTGTAPQFGPGFRGVGKPPSDPNTIEAYSKEMIDKGREIFRHDTFGSEAFWGGKLKLHQAILGEKQGGVGPGLTARQALDLGLKVDLGKLPSILVEAIKGGSVD